MSFNLHSSKSRARFGMYKLQSKNELEDFGKAFSKLGFVRTLINIKLIIYHLS